MMDVKSLYAENAQVIQIIYNNLYYTLYILRSNMVQLFIMNKYTKILRIYIGIKMYMYRTNIY